MLLAITLAQLATFYSSMSYESVAQCSCDAAASAVYIGVGTRERASEVKERPGQVDDVKERLARAVHMS
jgi:hypothetical protein